MPLICADVVLESERVRLEPLAEAHFEGVIAAGNDDELWAKVVSGNPFARPDGARAWFSEAYGDGRVAYAIVDRLSGKIAGSTQFYDIDSSHRKLEIGKTFIAQAFWRTHVNTEVKYLMLRHAFEEWNMLRVQLRAGAPNDRSRRAIERLGATHEGIMRSFFVHAVTGQPRDVAYYSILAQEWQAVKARLEAIIKART
jgi:N-acetyltransferase